MRDASAARNGASCWFAGAQVDYDRNGATGTAASADPMALLSTVVAIFLISRPLMITLSQTAAQSSIASHVVVAIDSAGDRGLQESLQRYRNLLLRRCKLEPMSACVWLLRHCLEKEAFTIVGLYASELRMAVEATALPREGSYLEYQVPVNLFLGHWKKDGRLVDGMGRLEHHHLVPADENQQIGPWTYIDRLMQDGPDFHKKAVKEASQQSPTGMHMWVITMLGWQPTVIGVFDSERGMVETVRTLPRENRYCMLRVPLDRTLVCKGPVGNLQANTEHVWKVELSPDSVPASDALMAGWSYIDGWEGTQSHLRYLQDPFEGSNGNSAK